MHPAREASASGRLPAFRTPLLLPAAQHLGPSLACRLAKQKRSSLARLPSACRRRRKIGEGAVRVNDEKVSEDQAHDWSNTLSDVGAFKVQVGKKRLALVKPV